MLRWTLFWLVGLARVVFVRRDASPDPLVEELRENKRFEGWLLVREVLFVVLVVGLVLLRASLS